MIVIYVGGGGIPDIEMDSGGITSVEVVIDKDLVSSLLARQLGADMLFMLTDVDAVYIDWGTAKAEAVIAFAVATGNRAAIGRLEGAPEIVAGRQGTRISPGGSR